MSDFIDYLIKHYDRLLFLLWQHLAVVGLSLLVSVGFALPVGYFILRRKKTSALIIGFFSAIYAVPSLALLSLIMQITGLGIKTAVTAISIYAQFILLRSVVTGFRSVSESVLEASRGMGLSSLEILNRIQLPLAAPVLMSGLRLATIASIGIATIAATVHSGGLGELLFEGIRTMNMVKIVWGILLSSALSFAANQIFVRLETWFSQKARGEAHRKTDMEIGKFDASL